MGSEMKLCRSLPPLVEGKIHGYLKLVIDKVIWLKRSPGEVRVFASWWGESDSAEFRPADITKNIIRPEHETSEIYAIRTNLSLFEQYVSNCETIELVIVSEKTNTIVGTSQITDLLNIFRSKPCFTYFPILNNSGSKIGDVHASIKFMYVTKPQNMQLKNCKNEKKQADDSILLSAVDAFSSRKDAKDDKGDFSQKLRDEENDVYKSILKSKRTSFQKPLRKFNNEVTDKLVAEVVARAQRLRGAILKETYSEDPLALSDSSFSEDLHSLASPENEAKLYEYFLGKDMTFSDERKALNTLRSTSPSSSLIDFASQSIRCNNPQVHFTPNKMRFNKTNAVVTEPSSEEKICSESKETVLLNHVDCIRIFVESLALNSAGYRRVKSSSLSRNDGTQLSVTYFVQYDTSFGYVKQSVGKSIKENRPVRICSKKQVDQVIFFNHDGIYSISKSKVQTDYVLKFKILIRHLNQKSPTELGIGTMCISDITKTENWTITQRLAIVNKGIKIGELNVTAELGSDFIHFGKQYVDGIMSTKENIPVLEIQSLLSTENNKSKSVTGTQSKTSNRVSPVSGKAVECLTTERTDLFSTKTIAEHKKGNMDDRNVNTKNHENAEKNKVLLHGLIYVAEGRELPETNTYLICRAFWREDKTISQICNNTKNPSYHFCQLVPLIHGTDLLDRIKDNYIVIEVYYRSNNVDNLLGLAKLPVHQLYVAYRDPLVLPHLLVSRYPVISVDGWVPIVNPVTGQSCGQLLSLVALGTAEQIALLEMSRGLRNITTVPHAIRSYPETFSGTSRLYNSQEPTRHDTFELQQSPETLPQHNNYTLHTMYATDREPHFSNLKTQECQTDITTVKEPKFDKPLQEGALNSEHLVLHTLVDRLAQVLTASKANMDQEAQTEVELEEKKQSNTEHQMCLNELNFNNISDDSDSSSLRNNFQLPTEMYRSVGVGAEYDEELDQQPNTSYSNTIYELPTTIQSTEKEQTDSECASATFRAVVEIECALHLPKVEKTNDTVEPSTYVSFQAYKSDSVSQLNSYTVTDIFPHSCNPRWNWKCDTRLPTELLVNDDKRLILKIWRVLDTDASSQINLERDIVIGFSAIDLSVLITGFPTVSGWFHIMDFTGKCNGQIKVSITPLDNLSSFGKPVSTLCTTRVPACNVSESSWSPTCSRNIHLNDIEQNNVPYTLSASVHDERKSVHTVHQITEPVVPISSGLEDASMSFLSLSLKQKLTELDEITKRLESRLRDVTNTAFEDDFENEFDLNEPNSDNEHSENRNVDVQTSINTPYCINKTWQGVQVDRKALYERPTLEDGIQSSFGRNENRNNTMESHIMQNRITQYGTINAGLSKVSGSCSSQSLSNANYRINPENEYSLQSNRAFDNGADHPVRGTKTHINHLLDKLSLQLPARSFSNGAMPIKKNIADLLTNLHQNNNNIQDNNKCNRQVCTVPTQTDNTEARSIRAPQIQMTSRSFGEVDEAYNDRNLSEVCAKSQTSNRISTVLREELVAEENSDTPKCDELSTYLITSNVRHMDLDTIFNPLLYQHLEPDLHVSNAVSPEGEAVEQLDNRYTRAFSTSIDDNRLIKVPSLMEVGGSSTSENNTQARHPRSVLESPENAELFRMTPSGVSENVDGNIDLTVVHKSSYNDLTASNSTESTTTISPDKSIMKQIEISAIENSYSTSSEASVPALSRQAPDGGNPVEDITKPLTVQQQDDSQDSSSSS